MKTRLILYLILLSAGLAQAQLSITPGGGLQSTDINTSAKLAAILGDESGTDKVAFTVQPQFGGWSINGQVYSDTDGDGKINFRLSATASSGFTLMSFGGKTSSFPALKRNGAGFDFRLADDSAYTSVQGLYDRFGSGSPEGAVTAPVGATYHRTDGGAITSLYVKESGAGNTGWVAK